MNRRRKKPAKMTVTEQLSVKWQQIEWQSLNQRALGLWQCLPKLHQRLLMVTVPLLLILLMLPAGKTPVEDAEPKRIALPVETIGLSEQTGSVRAVPLQAEQWREYTIRKGDTLAQAFRANQLPMSDLTALVKVEGDDRPLSQLKQGQIVRFKLNLDGRLEVLELNDGSQKVLFFRTSNGGFGRER